MNESKTNIIDCGELVSSECDVRNEPFEVLQKNTIAKKLSICKYPTVGSFVKPINGFCNHVIWGTLASAHDIYSIAGKTLESLIISKLNETQNRKLIFATEEKPKSIISCKKVTFELLSNMKFEIGYAELTIIDERNGVLFSMEDDLEYTLYCRDINVSPHPFPDVSDQMLQSAFTEDKADFANGAVEKFRTKHLQKNILPRCMEELK